MPQIYAKTARTIPTRQSDGVQLQPRTDDYGNIVTTQIGDGRYGALAEEAYFKATNPTMGTGIAMGVQTTFSETANVLAVLRNTAAAGGKMVIPEFLKLICTAAGSITTASDIAITIDTGNRVSSGGTSITPVNANFRSSAATIAALTFGAITATAASGSRRILARSKVKTQAAPCFTVGDEIIISFEQGSQDAMGLLSGSAATRIVVPVGACALDGTSSLLFHMWNTANLTTPPSWEFEMAWVER